MSLRLYAVRLQSVLFALYLFDIWGNARKNKNFGYGAKNSVPGLSLTHLVAQIFNKRSSILTFGLKNIYICVKMYSISTIKIGYFKKKKKIKHGLSI